MNNKRIGCIIVFILLSVFFARNKIVLVNEPK